MIIRDAVDTDTERLVKVYNDARVPVDCFDNKNISAYRFRQLVKGEEILLAAKGDQIVGFVSVFKPESFLHHIYVDPLFKNSGIAKALIQNCIDKYRLPLSLKCLVANEEACRFYEYMGWVAQSRGFSFDGPYNYYFYAFVEKQLEL